MSTQTIPDYIAAQADADQLICLRLRDLIDDALPEADARMWHAHPVWFLADNPIVGFGKLKHCIRLMFWSGQSFDTPGLTPTGTFKAAELRLTDAAQIDEAALSGWLAQSRSVQWDYKNIVRRKGRLERIT